MGRQIFSGPVSALLPEKDGSILIMPYDFQVFGTAVTQTRVVAGQYALTIGSSATTQLGVNLNGYVLGKVGTDPAISDTYQSTTGLAGTKLPGGGAGVTYASVAHIVRGVVVTGLSLLYRVNAAAATSITPTFYRSVYVGGATFPSTTNPITLTGTPTVTNAATPYVFAMTVGGGTTFDGLGPGFVVGANGNSTLDTLEIVFITPVTATIDFLGAILFCGHALL